MFRHINNRFIPLLASIFVFLAAFAAIEAMSQGEETSFGGGGEYAAAPLPDIIFTDSNNKEVKLSDYRGRVVLLNFWASWCGPCIKEMPALDKLQGELGTERFKVIAISEDGEFPEVDKFYQKHNIKNLEVFHDTGSKVFFELGLKGLPFSIIIDKDGKEVSRIEGFIDWNSGTRLIIDKLLE